MVHLIFRIDVGFDPQRGYGCAVLEIMPDKSTRTKGIRANTPEQLASRLRKVLIEELNKRKDFPLEQEPKLIISPNGF